jgi:predicted ATP-grasp superfamily ATP-dependent carboligase
MATSVLLISTTPRWFGTARVPERLAKSGFEVSLLTPENSLAEKSRFVGKVGHLPDGATTMEWVHAFAAMVAAVAPRMVIACDDTAQRLLQTLVVSPPPAMRPEMHLQLAQLVRESIGDPAHYRTSTDKTQLAQAAQALGIRVPPFVVAATLEEAESFAADQHFDVVLKRGFGSAGSEVVLVSTREELARAYADLTGRIDLNLEGATSVRILLQARIPGLVRHHTVAAMRGKLLAGVSREKLIANPSPKGPATVTRYFRVPEMRSAAEKLVSAFGMTGLFAFEFIAHEKTGECYLLEINRRVTPGTHAAAQVGVDLCGALYAALHGLPLTMRSDLDPDEEHTLAHFPSEWLRDPNSRYLREYPVDAPWDDPGLFEAMLALRHEPDTD